MVFICVLFVGGIRCSLSHHELCCGADFLGAIICHGVFCLFFVVDTSDCDCRPRRSSLYPLYVLDWLCLEIYVWECVRMHGNVGLGQVVFAVCVGVLLGALAWTRNQTTAHTTHQERKEVTAKNSAARRAATPPSI